MNKSVNEEKKKALKLLQDSIRYKGDDIHNRCVIACQKGELLTQRKGCGSDDILDSDPDVQKRFQPGHLNTKGSG